MSQYENVSKGIAQITDNENMGKFRRQLSQLRPLSIGMIALLFFIAIAFQNCSAFRPNDETRQAKSEGDVYDGKVVYLEVVPGFSCEQKSAPKSILVGYPDKTWRRTVNEQGKCATINDEIVNEVVHSEGSPFATFGSKDFYRDLVAPDITGGLSTYFVEFNVSASGDPNTIDLNPGDGICADTSGRCSLRAAFEEMNTDVNRSALIDIPAGTYNLTSGLPYNLLGVVYIRGAGKNLTILDGGGQTPIFVVTNPNNVNSVTIVDGVRIQNGYSSRGSGYFKDAGFALTAYNSLHIRNSIVSNGQAPNSSGVVVYDRAHIWIEDSQFLNNSGSVLSTHYASDLSIERSQFLDNSGRAVFAYAPERAKIGNSTFARNEIGIQLTACQANCSIANSTITENRDYGLMWGMSSTAPDFYLRNTTVYNNATVRNQNMLIGYGGGIDQTFHIENSIVAMAAGARANSNCLIGTAPPKLTVVAQGLIASDLSCAANATVVDPMLGPLADNGGPTLTRALLAGSPAIDTGSNALCLPSDQRGLPRPVAKLSSAPICDIGAVEAQ